MEDHHLILHHKLALNNLLKAQRAMLATRGWPHCNQVTTNHSLEAEIRNPSNEIEITGVRLNFLQIISFLNFLQDL